MSLLMDALRKAEQQKQKIASAGQSDFAEMGGKLELEPMPAHQGQPPSSETALPSLTGLDYAPPGEVSVPPPAVPPSGALGKTGGGLPKLPTRLEDLDEQFIAHAAESKATLAAGKRPPPAAAPVQPTPAKAPASSPTLTGATAEQTRSAFREPVMASAAPAREPAVSSPVSAPAPGSSPETAREAARNLFEVKQPEVKGRSNRSFAIAAGLITMIATVGIGAYFWWQMQPKGSFITGGAAPQPSPAPVSAAPTIPIVPIVPPTGTVTPAPQAMQPVVAVPPAPTIPPVAQATDKRTTAQGTVPERNDEDSDDRPSRQVAAKPPVSGAASLAPAGPRTQEPLRVTARAQKLNPLLEQAFDAFNRGELEVAQVAWQKILQSDPKNADALQGLAAVAQQRQQPDRAADYYLRALEADPKNALALSGLVSLRGHADPQQTESRIKSLLAEQPDSPFLNFALGNLYARSLRWADAQQSYFRAHAADPGNPDYLFNLAVSLDQLHQPRLAAQYYNQAVGAAAQRPAGFDITEASARQRVLQP